MIPFVGLMLTGKFTSLDEPTEVSEVAVIVVFPVDIPKFTDLTGVYSLEIQHES
jgi:hypothetical protein